MSVKIQKITACPGGHVVIATAFVKGEKVKKTFEVPLTEKRKFQEVAEEKFSKKKSKRLNSSK